MDSTPSSVSRLEFYLSQIYKWSKFLTHNAQDADDLCQEVCLHTLLAENSFREEAEFSTWLYRITINVYKDTLRKQHRNLRLANPERSESVLGIPIESNRTVERVQAALQHLRPQQRKILEWKYFDGLSNAEIAKLLCIKESSVSRSLYRAREAFKKQYSLRNSVTK